MVRSNRPILTMLTHSHSQRVKLSPKWIGTQPKNTNVDLYLDRLSISALKISDYNKDDCSTIDEGYWPMPTSIYPATIAAPRSALISRRIRMKSKTSMLASFYSLWPRASGVGLRPDAWGGSSPLRE